MFFLILPYSERHQVVDLFAIEAQYHVGVNLFNFVLVVANDHVKASVGVDLSLQSDAFLDLVEALVEDLDFFWPATLLVIFIRRTRLVHLLIRH